MIGQKSITIEIIFKKAKFWYLFNLHQVNIDLLLLWRKLPHQYTYGLQPFKFCVFINGRVQRLRKQALYKHFADPDRCQICNWPSINAYGYREVHVNDLNYTYRPFYFLSPPVTGHYCLISNVLDSVKTTRHKHMKRIYG